MRTLKLHAKDDAEKEQWGGRASWTSTCATSPVSPMRSLMLSRAAMDVAAGQYKAHLWEHHELEWVTLYWKWRPGRGMAARADLGPRSSNKHSFLVRSRSMQAQEGKERRGCGEGRGGGPLEDARRLEQVRITQVCAGAAESTPPESGPKDELFSTSCQNSTSSPREIPRSMTPVAAAITAG